jgi:hypothetical protein
MIKKGLSRFLDAILNCLSKTGITRCMTEEVWPSLLAKRASASSRNSTARGLSRNVENSRSSDFSASPGNPRMIEGEISSNLASSS